MSSRRFVRFTGLLTLFALVSLASPAWAFVTLKGYGGGDIYWNTSSIKWYLHPNGSSDATFDQVQNAIADAFGAWAAPSCFTKSFVYSGTRTYDPGDGVYISFVENNWDPTVDGAAAYAMTWKSWGGQVITNGVIVFNGEDIHWSVADDLSPMSMLSDIQGVATHELGHIVGLDHTRVREATMFFSGGGLDMRSLEPDDENGLCYIYGGFNDGEPCDSCDSSADCASGSCLQYADGETYCGRNCTTDSACPSGFYCKTISSTSKQCVSTNGYCNQQGSNIAIGSFCYGMETCQTGLCLVVPGDAYCTKQCSSDADCYSSMPCNSGYCMKEGNLALGEACGMHIQCASGYCHTQGATAYCSQSCTSPSECPDGFACSGGYCVLGGVGSYGQPCDDDSDCQSLLCDDIGGGETRCSTACDSDSQCPGTDLCVLGVCSPTGPMAFGGACATDADCQSGLCKGFGSNRYCSLPCTQDDNCPGDATCLSDATCSQASDVAQPCSSNSECALDEVCLKLTEEAEYGICVVRCNPFADSGCDEGLDCQWFYLPWTGEIVGACIAYGEPFANEKEPCDSIPCRPALVCASVEDDVPRCFQDCKLDSALGCSSNEACVAAEETPEPNRGICLCQTDCEPLPEPDVVQPEGDVITEDAPVAVDSTVQSEDEIAEIQPGDTTPTTPQTPSSGGGGCQTSSTSSTAGLVLLLGALMGLIYGTRRRTLRA